MRWLRWLRAAAPAALAALAAPAASPAFNILFIGLLGTHTAYSTSNWSSGCAGCVGCAQLHQLRWLRWLRLLRHLRSIYCSLGFWGPILPIVLRIGALAALPEIGPAVRSCVDGTDARSCVFKTVTFTRMVRRPAASCQRDSWITAPPLLLRLQPLPWHWTTIGTWTLYSTVVLRAKIRKTLSFVIS